MKEMYVSPETKLVSFVSSEKLANNIIEFDKLLQVGIDGTGGAGDPTNPASNDININTGA